MGTEKSSSILLSIILIITGFATLVFGNYIVFAFALATNSNYDGVAATNYFNITGNVSQNDSVNFTMPNGNIYSFGFNFTGHTNGLPTGYIYVNMTNGENGTATVSQNLSSRINNNATLSAVITALNGSAGTIIRYNSVGRVGNNYALSMTEDTTNAAWSNSRLTGGTDVVSGQSATLNYASIVLPLMGLLLLVLGFVFLMGSISGFNITALGGGKSGGGLSVGKGSSSNSGTSERSSSSGEGRG